MQDQSSLGIQRISAAGPWAAHPLMEELPMEVIRCLDRHGRSVSLAMGAVLPDVPVVRFVTSGAVGVFPTPESSCVGFIGPGSLHGLDQCFAPPTNEHLATLLDAELVEVSAEDFVQALGRVWTERMFAHQATGRLRAMASEAACGTRHTVAQRTARWLIRLVRPLPHLERSASPRPCWLRPSGFSAPPRTPHSAPCRNSASSQRSGGPSPS